MIAKITKGSSATAIGKYLHGPGNREEHHYDESAHGRVISSNIAPEGTGDPSWTRTMTRIIDRRAEGAAKPVYQASLRAAPTDRIMSDAEWGQIAREWLADMGAGDRPYAVVRHGADHVHIVVSRTGFDRSLWNPRNDFRACQTACRRVEKAHGLVQLPEHRQQRQPIYERATIAERAIWERGGTTGKEQAALKAMVSSQVPRALDARAVESATKSAQGRIDAAQYAVSQAQNELNRHKNPFTRGRRVQAVQDAQAAAARVPQVQDDPAVKAARQQASRSEAKYRNAAAAVRAIKQNKVKTLERAKRLGIQPRRSRSAQLHYRHR